MKRTATTVTAVASALSTAAQIHSAASYSKKLPSASAMRHELNPNTPSSSRTRSPRRSSATTGAITAAIAIRSACSHEYVSTAIRKITPVTSLVWKQHCEQPRSTSRQYGAEPSATAGSTGRPKIVAVDAAAGRRRRRSFRQVRPWPHSPPPMGSRGSPGRFCQTPSTSVPSSSSTLPTERPGARVTTAATPMWNSPHLHGDRGAVARGRADHARVAAGDRPQAVDRCRLGDAHNSQPSSVKFWLSSKPRMSVPLTASSTVSASSSVRPRSTFRCAGRVRRRAARVR